MRQILISRKIFNTGSIISNGNGSLPVLDCCNSTLHKRDFWFVRNPIVSISVARHHLFADVTLILCCRQISFHFSVPGGCILGEIWTKFWYLYLGSDQHYNLCRLLPPTSATTSNWVAPLNLWYFLFSSQMDVEK